MKTLIKSYPISPNLLTKPNSLFYDIETTGFSRTTAFIYLIGCSLIEEGQNHIYQFLAENRSDEPVILHAFFDLITTKKPTTLISFNGISFDTPFIEERAKKWKIESVLKNYEQLDIFKEITPLKKPLALENLKQKTVEDFLGIQRDDKYNGGELIKIYLEYEKNADKESEDLVLLHNHEDVLNMTPLFQILSYIYEFNSTHEITAVEVTEKEILADFKLKHFLPKPVSFYNSTYDYYIKLNKDTGKIKIPINDGYLRYYYTNYKDYKFLPLEDTVIHKNIASFVDKSHLSPATKENCYTKKEATPEALLPENLNDFINHCINISINL